MCYMHVNIFILVLLNYNSRLLYCDRKNISKETRALYSEMNLRHANRVILPMIIIYKFRFEYKIIYK